MNVAEAAAEQALAEFQSALERVGFSVPQRDAIIATSGCINIAMLGLLSAEQVSQLCRRIEMRPINPLAITAIQEQLLLAMRFWVSNLQRLQQPIIADNFNMLVALNQSQQMRQQLEDDTRAEKDMVAKIPDKFKSAGGWKVFAEALETFLSQILGSGRIPLRYVIRRTETPEQNAAYANDQERNIALAPLQGPSFQRDNNKVYSIIKQLTLEGPGRSYILPYDATANGRAAWFALVNHFEGDGFRNRSIEDAYSTLENLSYEGEKRGFNFEKFVERHMDAYLELARHNEPVNESKKVRDFLSRIKAPQLQAAVQQVRATMALATSFSEAANFIALSVVPIRQNRGHLGSPQT